MNGVLVVDKPAGITSHDVVDRVRKALGTKKVGHAGTLDPDATGVLVLGIGTATRLLDYAKDVPKRYTALATFGVSTTTQDASGEVVSTRPVDLTEDEVRAALKRFEGAIDQVPPMVSAVKIGGERLYKKARRGEVVERPARRVTIHSVALTSFDGLQAVLDVACSAGTYIRTLVHDLGEELGCGAHLAALRRTEATGFGERDAVALDEVSPAALRPVLDLVRSLPRLDLSEDAARLVANGRALDAERAGADDLAEGALVALVRGDELRAVYRRAGDALTPDKVVPA